MPDLVGTPNAGAGAQRPARSVPVAAPEGRHPDATRQGEAPSLGHLRDRLALALEAGGLGAWEWDIPTGTVVWDETLEALYGLDPGSFDGTLDNYRLRIHPDDRAAAAETVAVARREGRGYETEHRIVRPDGSVRWTQGWARPLVNPDGEVIAFIGVVADVTARRARDEERERALAESAALAATLQRSLLPPLPPDIPGLDVAVCYHPALEGLAIGGDFYDLPRLGRNTWALVLGDVCGKGAAAAAITGLVRYSARAAATPSVGPAAVLRQVSEVLRRDQLESDDSRFATMVFARLRPRPGSLGITFALGGHPQPYVVRADSSVDTVGSHGTLLGVFADTDFSNTRVTLRPGDSFVVVTDGVLEARNAEGDDFAPHLPALLARHATDTAATMVEAIERAALAWQDGPPVDDIAVVVLRVPPSD